MATAIEKNRERARAWAKANPERNRARARAWGDEHAERAREKSREWYANNLPKRWAYNLKVKFNLLPETYGLMLLSQNRVCAICNESCGTGRKLAVDHDHKTGQIRGLLCVACNTAIGKFRDSPQLLRKAADYLERNFN